MTQLPLQSRDVLQARAHLIAERLDLKNFEISDLLATTPLTVNVDAAGGVAVLFRYGVVVFFGVTEDGETRFVEALKPLIQNPSEVQPVESIAIHRGKATIGVQSGAVWLDEISVEKMQIIADALSKSLVLALYETKIADEFDGIIPLASELATTGKVSANAKTLLSKIGGMLLIEHRMVGRAEVGDKPETLWEFPLLGGLYAQLEDEFELHERHSALERKLNLISRTAQTLAEIVETKQVHRLEWYVIGLIFFELVVGLIGLARNVF